MVSLDRYVFGDLWVCVCVCVAVIEREGVEVSMFYILISDRGTCCSDDFRASVSNVCSDKSMPA